MATCITKLAYQECLDRTSTSSESTSRTLELTNMTTATSTLREFDFLMDVNASALRAAKRKQRSREQQQEQQKLCKLRHQTQHPGQASAYVSLPPTAFSFTFTPHLELK